MTGGVLLLDTSVWRDAAQGREWLLRVADRDELRLAISSEAVEELAVAALATTKPGEYEEIRMACRLARRHAEEGLQPAVWHLAGEVGLDPGPGPDPRRVCERIAGCESQEALRESMDDPISVGAGHQVELGEWVDLVEREKRDWLASISGALEEIIPGVTTARRDGRPHFIGPGDYRRLKEGALADSSALVEVERIRMRNTLASDIRTDWDSPRLRTCLRHALDAFVAAFTEAILDRFDGPHNEGQKKIKFEPNDWFDLAQLRYLQEGRRWVTGDQRWVGVARRAGLADSVLLPSSV